MRLQKVRNVIKMPLKLLFLCGKITNIAHWLGAPPPGPSLGHTQVASLCLAQGLNYRIFEKKNFFHLSLAKSRLRVWQHLQLQIEFSSNYSKAATKGGGGERRGGTSQTKISPTQTPKRQWEKILVGLK